MVDGGSHMELRDKFVEHGWLAKVHRWVSSCAWSLAVPMLNRRSKKVPTTTATATIERLPSSKWHRVPNNFQLRHAYQKLLAATL